MDGCVQHFIVFLDMTISNCWCLPSLILLSLCTVILSMFFSLSVQLYSLRKQVDNVSTDVAKILVNSEHK